MRNFILIIVCFLNIVSSFAQTVPSKVEGSIGSISSTDVTTSSHKEFKWYDLGKAPKAMLAAMKAIKIKGVSLWDKVKQEYGDCDISIAAIDLNENGILGIAVNASGSICCGSRGCSYDFYEDGGTLTCDLGIDYEVKPGINGVVSSSGKFFRLHLFGNYSIEERTKLVQSFKYNKSQTTVQKSNSTKMYPGGGKTPDELGRILLAALKTNNKASWNLSIHPIETRYLDFNKQAFDKFRQKLMQSGVSDWSLIKFSRVTFDTRTFAGTDDEGKANGEQIYRNFTIEFTYKSEFIGGIGRMTILSVSKAKYYIFFAGTDAGIGRK